MLWPNGSRTIPTVTSEYGPRTPIDTNGDGRPDTSNFHAGIDLVGFPINKSPANGVVIFAQYNGGAGNEVRVRADNGDVFRIKHNARFLVSVGQRVTEGQAVGVMGTTGASTGIHCHFECWPGGIAHTNPRGYMATHLSAAGGGGGGGIIDERNDMSTYALRNDGPAALGIDKGAVFIGQGTDPLVWVANPGPEVTLLGVPVAPWNADAIAKRIGEVGLRGSGPDINKVFASMEDARAKPSRPAYTLGGGTVNLGEVKVPSDPAVLEALKSVGATLGELLKATKALNPPG